MNVNEVYIGLGANLGNPLATLKSALSHISSLPFVDKMKASSFYRTSPVSDLPQPPYVNAACRIETTLSAFELLRELQRIELLHGKRAKPKNAPRVLDLDILFFRREYHHTDALQIPHRQWHQRLFVLVPLCELTPTISFPSADGNIECIDLNQLIRSLSSCNGESVSLLNESKYPLLEDSYAFR